MKGCYAAGTPCGVRSHLPVILCVSEIMPVAVLGRIDPCTELVMLSLVVRHRRHLFTKQSTKHEKGVGALVGTVLVIGRDAADPEDESATGGLSLSCRFARLHNSILAWSTQTRSKVLSHRDTLAVHAIQEKDVNAIEKVQGVKSGTSITMAQTRTNKVCLELNPDVPTVYFFSLVSNVPPSRLSIDPWSFACQERSALKACPS